jgi:hypothetical protein
MLWQGLDLSTSRILRNYGGGRISVWGRIKSAYGTIWAFCLAATGSTTRPMYGGNQICARHDMDILLGDGFHHQTDAWQ